jgi:hypothetical protein
MALKADKERQTCQCECTSQMNAHNMTVSQQQVLLSYQQLRNPTEPGSKGPE